MFFFIFNPSLPNFKDFINFYSFIDLFTITTNQTNAIEINTWPSPAIWFNPAKSLPNTCNIPLAVKVESK